MVRKMQLQIVWISLLLLIAITLIQCSKTNHTDQPEVYLVKTGLVSDTVGTFGCGDRLVAITPDKILPWGNIAGYISALLNTPGSDTLHNAVYNPGIRVRVEKRPADSTLVVHLKGEFRIGGVCDHPRIKRQLSKTVLQFAPWKNAEFYINNQPLNSYTDLSGRGDGARETNNDTP